LLVEGSVQDVDARHKGEHDGAAVMSASANEPEAMALPHVISPLFAGPALAY